MKQFIYAKRYNKAYTDPTAGFIGSVGDIWFENMNLNLVDENKNIKQYPVRFIEEPLVTITSFDNANGYHAEFSIPEVQPYSDYTVIFIKKGKQFNERSNWTCTIHTGANTDNVNVAKQIETYLKNNKASLQLSIELDGADITITGPATGENYEIKLADELLNVEITQEYGSEGIGTLEYVKDLAAKCAADAGFEYTAEDALELYPGLNFDFTDGEGNKVETFDILNLRFTEPRLTGTREESVYQMIHVAMPRGEAQPLAKAITGE